MSFFNTCPICKGTGEVPSNHPYAVPQGGTKTGVNSPRKTGGCSGDVIAEFNLSYCGRCLGCGVVLPDK